MALICTSCIWCDSAFLAVCLSLIISWVMSEPGTLSLRTSALVSDRVSEACLWRSPLFWWHLSSSSQPTLRFVGDKHPWVPGTHYCQLTLSTDPCRMTHVKVKSLHLLALCFVKQAEVFVPQQERGSAIMGVYLRTNLWVNGEMQAGYGLIALVRKRLPPADLETVFWKRQRAQKVLTARECDQTAAG